MDALTVLLWIAGGLFAAAAVLTLWRTVIGPSALDRIVAMDVMIAVVIGAIAIVTVSTGVDTGLPMALVLSLLGFSGAVAMSRLISGSRLGGRRYRERLENRQTEEKR